MPTPKQSNERWREGRGVKSKNAANVSVTAWRSILNTFKRCQMYTRLILGKSNVRGEILVRANEFKNILQKLAEELERRIGSSIKREYRQITNQSVHGFRRVNQRGL